jgi:L-lysine 2,3-aminomutase
MVLNVGQKQYTRAIKEVKKKKEKRQKIGETEKEESEKVEEKQAFPFKLTPQLVNVLNNSHACP